MVTRALIEPPRIFPTFRYKDAARMIDWLDNAFGFTVHAKYADETGVIQHAQLALGSSMIMLGTVRDDAYGRMVGEPGQNGGKSVYVAVDDADALYTRAKAAGAQILEEPTDRDYGSREFICADPEGNVWSFGTYWPKADEPAA
ncbi:glyoxalase [Pseudaminobacter arsenicus]|uniref:Glyoxalase n=1 Tax=Borborobacter arsenicus TaxID=1851146 RepID=A0A432VBY4_9HYPH|nr:VOC family protein [Pseudaminobacter arsenicus]RUM99644.1 glyoxalase [Pseudaminobacter arsenicus]